MSDGISTATRGTVFEVTIDRPKANAIDLAASRRLNQVFTAFRDDPALRNACPRFPRRCSSRRW